MVRLEELNPPDLANTAWAFATLGARQEELLGPIARPVLLRLDALLSSVTEGRW